MNVVHVRTLRDQNRNILGHCGTDAKLPFASIKPEKMGCFDAVLVHRVIRVFTIKKPTHNYFNHMHADISVLHGSGVI